MSITHNTNLSLTYTNNIGVTLTTVKLYEYEVGGMWNLLETDTNLAALGTIDYVLEQDNLYKIVIEYTSGANTIKVEYEYLVTDTTEDIVAELMLKVVCKCNDISRDKQKVYYRFNRLLMLIASFMSYAWKHHGESTNEYVDSQMAKVSQINQRIEDFYTNCTFDECTESTCSCL